MKTIWKFKVEDRLEGEAGTMLPAGAKFLSAQFQHGGLHAWFLVDPNAEPQEVQFEVKGTGHAFDPEGLEYLTTVLDGYYVWHIFMLRLG